MIVVTAQIWPKGSQAEAREILNMTVTNQGLAAPVAGNDGQRYTYAAHVMTRPYPNDGLLGFEADVEVQGHRAQDGSVPLIVSALAAANTDDPNIGFYIPPSRRMAYEVIATLDEFDARLKGRK